MSLRLVQRSAFLLLFVSVPFAVSRSAGAQPFGVWSNLTGYPTQDYIRVPHSPALNPTSRFTFEAWVNLHGTSALCSSIAGKDFTSSWWVGFCGTTLRSYLRGSASARDGGTIPASGWTHIAVTYDGTNRRHYIDGELVGTFAETGPIPTNTKEVRIGSDVSWEVTPQGSINEVRLWSVARTLSQIRAAINLPIRTPQTGLIAVWPSGITDVVGGHNGNIHGTVTGGTFPVTLNCGSGSPTSLCLQSRFSVTSEFRTGAPGTAEGEGRVVPVANPGSGLFYFFSVNNWELMVKSIDACGLNDRYWLFSAATTNVFYRLSVLDVRAGVRKVYFNYPGPPAPAVTDTDAFATCP